MIDFIKAKLIDIQTMQELASPEVESGIILIRSNDEIATNIRSYILAKENSELVGFCALHIHTPFLGEIRSLIVKENKRGYNIGNKLVVQALDEGKTLGLKQVLSLTYKQTFFEKLGFLEIPKESLPEHKIWADCIKCKHRTTCNKIFLIKNL